MYLLKTLLQGGSRRADPYGKGFLSPPGGGMRLSDSDISEMEFNDAIGAEPGTLLHSLLFLILNYL